MSEARFDEDVERWKQGGPNLSDTYDEESFVGSARKRDWEAGLISVVDSLPKKKPMLSSVVVSESYAEDTTPTEKLDPRKSKMKGIAPSAPKKKKPEFTPLLTGGKLKINVGAERYAVKRNSNGLSKEGDGRSSAKKSADNGSLPLPPARSAYQSHQVVCLEKFISTLHRGSDLA